METDFRYKLRLFIENVYYNTLIKSKTESNAYIDWYKQNKNFSIMSFNLKNDRAHDKQFNWMYRKHLCADVIKKYSPNVISLQELNPHMHKYLISELSDVYGYYSAERNTGKELDRTIRIYSTGLSIFYNKEKYELINKGVYWLSDTPEKPSATWGHDERRMVIFVLLKDKQSGKYFYVYNAHYDHTGSESRLKSSEFLVNLSKDNVYDSFICGDFNASYDDAEMEPLNKIFDNNVIDKTPTFTGFRFAGTKIIDMIYSNKKGCYINKVIKEPCNGLNISDHCPVIIEEK